ncbi:biotin--[acetyl-CoA-carboxylase] ligase [Mycolicibacterium arabiense]|uniref:biotin--[biotin carboxyl-carrier protein] ligase n=1 Tax=Mycolicibacterium arabiense TaxID=1286181 RepID=A0A7I7RZ00_9MYCO|nr:biotin--[acetyl-CoA-carboxylase] ligase [Mycolicibacterium arabiense]MCV7373730.1 biotin--[acetyl-CoA-carboxylase] ligase [Mycolicibacterium arabiense]BBY48975.1 biotin--[acetyl-CoA-carboxylase] ligase [Mycolicibacterium arabiense]
MADDVTREPLDAKTLREAVIVEDSAWRLLDVVNETGSTNADLIARAAAGEDVAGAVLIAENQIAGRGRNGRTWSAVPRAQVSMSMSIPNAGLPAATWGWVPLVTGLAVVDAVADVAGVRAGLKWPNDVLAGPESGKLAGILAEVSVPAGVIVVGVGLNVSLRQDELPDPAATSLLALGAADVDRTALVAAMLRQMARRIDALRRSEGVDPELVDEYVERSLTVGRRVRATLPGDREVVGQAVGVDEQGRLRIDTDVTGTGSDVVVVSAGDIVHLRPV